MLDHRIKDTLTHYLHKWRMSKFNATLYASMVQDNSPDFRRPSILVRKTSNVIDDFGEE